MGLNCWGGKLMNENTLFDRSAIAMNESNDGMDNTINIDDMMKKVMIALEAKGYNPANQLVGYVMSGDPTYITSHGDARLMIQSIERDELLETLIKRYLDSLK